MKITTILISVLLVLALLSSAQTKVEENNPPANLQAQHVLDDPNVNLTWWAPGTPYWLHYDQGVYANGIGWNGPAVFDVAIKYEPEQLLPFNGMEITKFSFVPAESAATYIIKFWINENADSVVYSDTLSGLTIKDWNVIDLKSALIIDADNTYYFGYNCIAEAGYPAGCDYGPTVAPGKSDLLRTDGGQFISLHNDANVSLNLNIQVYLQSATAKGVKPVAIADINNNSANIAGIKRLMFQKQKHFSKPKPKGATPDSYKIYRDDIEVGTSTVPNYSDVLTDEGIFTYEVSAIYSGEESVKSNSVQVIYDNSRVPYNTIITETFINVGETNGSMNSPASPGPFMGIKDLEFEVDNIAPIIYHSGTQILGNDPFSTVDGEERFMYYMAVTGSFPMTLFNSRLFQGGGGAESMYGIYKHLYDSALTLVTPMAFECNLERVSNTKYMLNATAKKVGIFNTQNMVLHVVLTREIIDYSWNGGNFSDVKFVASGMFPDFEGTTLNFVGDTMATASVELEVDMFEPIDNYRVIAFVQSATGYAIYNGDMLKLPKKRSVEFTVVDDETSPIEGAAVSTNGETKVTDADGVANFAIFDNMGELEYTVLHDGFSEVTGYFNMDTTETVLVNLLSTDIDNTVHIKSSIYPNPANNVVNIVTDINTEVKIFNSLGVVVFNYKQQQYSQTVDLSDYNNGVYFINISSKNQNQSFRLVKTD